MAQFGQELRILDRDHRLVSKACHQFEFALLEGTHLAASDDHHADRLTLPRERRECLRPNWQIAQHASDFSAFIRKARAAILERNLAIVENRAHCRIRWFEREIGQGRPDLGHVGTCRTDDTEDIALDAPEVDVGGIEHPRRCFSNRVECALTVLGGAGNDTEDVGSRGLAIEALAQLIEQPRVLDGDHGLGGEILY